MEKRDIKHLTGFDAEQRANAILEVIMAYATLDYSKKAPVNNEADVFDALATGVNMLGEELQATTVSLKEKEVLLKEIHHRVKNNLQIISSILSIQSQYISDPIALDKFNECRTRIKSMALVHEKVYESNKLNGINFKEYVHSLISSYQDLFELREGSIEVSYVSDDDSKQVHIDVAMPLSLIINELMANCFKYAFTEENNNRISIEFSGNGHAESPYVLIISDNGIGAQGKFDPNNPNSMGAVLIGALIEQLSATISIEDRSGTIIRLEFRK